MDTQPDFGKELLSHIVGGVAKAVSERNGETRQQQFARSQAAVHMIMGLLPRDVIEAMLAGHCVMLHELMTDSVQETLRGEIDTMRRGTGSNLVSLNKAFCGTLDRLRRYQMRPAEGRRDGPEAAADIGAETAAAEPTWRPEPAGHDGRTNGASGESHDAAAETHDPTQARAAPTRAPAGHAATQSIAPTRLVPCETPAASGHAIAPTRLVPCETPAASGHAAGAHGSTPASQTRDLQSPDPQTPPPQTPARQTPAPAAAPRFEPASPGARGADATPFPPSPEAVSACRANPEAMAALEAGDAERFARAMGIDMPGEAYLAAAAVPGSAFDRRPPGSPPPVAAAGRTKR